MQYEGEAQYLWDANNLLGERFGESANEDCISVSVPRRTKGIRSSVKANLF